MRKRSKTTRQRPLHLEFLESRKLLTTLVALHFDSTTQAELESVLPGRAAWRDRPSSGGMMGFVQGFSGLDGTRHGFLDLNSDGTLDTADGEIAVARIMDKVRADFAPYNVEIFRTTSVASADAWLRANPANDTLIFVNGSNCCAGGQAPEDAGNRSEDVGAAGDTVRVAELIATAAGRSTPTEAVSFVNIMSNFITHEIGHTFGLSHVDISTHPEADDRNVMDPFLWVNDTEFWNVPLAVDGGGVQYQHAELLRVLGPGSNAWSAVHRPGVLTIQGYGGADGATVTPGAGGGWNVVVTTNPGAHRMARFVDPSATPAWFSINQFDTAITTIEFLGRNGNDRLLVDDTITAGVRASGGAGNDYIETGGGNDRINGGRGADVLLGGDGRDFINGGTGNDVIWGEGGNDYLIGAQDSDEVHGGDGNDVLSDLFDRPSETTRSNDRLFGDKGNDLLFGGLGRDELRGGFGDDILIGGVGNDELHGGLGSDVLLGGRGNDILDGGDLPFSQSVDYLFGGSGNDCAVGGLDAQDLLLSIEFDKRQPLFDPQDPIIPPKGDPNDNPNK